jgi:hypothetical protein
MMDLFDWQPATFAERLDSRPWLEYEARYLWSLETVAHVHALEYNAVFKAFQRACDLDPDDQSWWIELPYSVWSGIAQQAIPQNGGHRGAMKFIEPVGYEYIAMQLRDRLSQL